MPHLGSVGVRAGGHEREPDRFGAMRALILHRVVVRILDLVIFDPHELEASRAGSNLCSHTV